MSIVDSKQFGFDGNPVSTCNPNNALRFYSLSGLVHKDVREVANRNATRDEPAKTTSSLLQRVLE